MFWNNGLEQLRVTGCCKFWRHNVGSFQNFYENNTDGKMFLWRRRNLKPWNFCRTQEGPAYTWLFNFHTFRPSTVRLLDQILVPTHSLRDKGPQGQHRNKGTIQEQRDNTGTKEQRNNGSWKLGTWEVGNLGNWELGNLVTWKLWNLGTWELSTMIKHSQKWSIMIPECPKWS